MVLVSGSFIVKMLSSVSFRQGWSPKRKFLKGGKDVPLEMEKEIILGFLCIEESLTFHNISHTYTAL